MAKGRRTSGEIARAAQEYAESRLSGRTLEHTRGCVESAQKLGLRFRLDKDKTLTAAYLHDIAKALSKDKQAELARELGMSDDEIASYPLSVLHGPLAALIARDNLGVYDPETLQAIAAHSSGCAKMSEVAKVVFIADYIEESRVYPGADELRSHGDVTLDDLTMAVLRRKLNYLIEENKDIDPRAIELWNELALARR